MFVPEPVSELAPTTESVVVSDVVVSISPDKLTEEIMQEIVLEEEPMVSVRRSYPESTPHIGEAEIIVSETVSVVPKVQQNDVESSLIGPEDPAEDEGNVCISCQ